MKLLTRLSVFLPLAVTLVWLQFLPERVPLRYDFSGVVDHWGSKWENLLLPGIVLLLGAFFWLADCQLRRSAKENEQKSAYGATNRKVLRVIMIATALFFTGFQAFLLHQQAQAGAAAPLQISTFTAIGMGVLFIVLGNVMPKSRRNSVLGLRCAWSQYNDVTWQRSNRFGGIVLAASGLVSIVGALLGTDAQAIPIMLTALLLALVLSLIYARRVFLREREKVEAQKGGIVPPEA